MSQRVCPWWLGYLLASPLRRLIQNPAPILSPLVRPGMTILEPGPGMGFFTLPMARLAGPSGRVIALDLQSRMLDGLSRRAQRAGLASRVITRQVSPDSLQITDLASSVDLVFAFAMVHEVPNPESLIAECCAALKPGGHFFLAEPTGHVTVAQFEAELLLAARCGLHLLDRPSIRRSHAALLNKP